MWVAWVVWVKFWGEWSGSKKWCGWHGSVNIWRGSKKWRGWLGFKVFCYCSNGIIKCFAEFKEKTSAGVCC